MILANISVPRWNNICRFKIWPYFRGELRDFEKMYNPMTISELKRYLFTSKWGFATDRNKLDSVGNNPPPPFIFVWSCQLNQCLGLLCLRQCFVVSNDCHDFKSQPWSSLAAVHKLATGWLWCPGKNDNSLKCCRLSFVFFTTLQIIQVIFGCFQACCFARMMF